MKDEGRYILKPIVEVKAGDYVLSLNEATQAIEPHRINGLLDMGVKPVYKLTTASGRSIKTTANHPYLVQIKDQKLNIKNEKQKISKQIQTTDDWRLETGGPKWVKVSELKAGDEIGVFNEHVLSLSVGDTQNRQLIKGLLELLKPLSLFPLFFTSFCRVDNYASKNENYTQNSNSDSPKKWEFFKEITCQSNYKNGLSQVGYCLGNKFYFLFGHFFHPRKIYHRLQNLSRLFTLGEAEAAKVTDTLPGSDIFWDRIVSIEYAGNEQVYDIEVEGTHNFIGNSIFAHNTYIQESGQSPVIGPQLPETRRQNKQQGSIRKSVLGPLAIMTAAIGIIAGMTKFSIKDFSYLRDEIIKSEGPASIENTSQKEIAELKDRILGNKAFVDRREDIKKLGEMFRNISNLSSTLNAFEEIIRSDLPDNLKAFAIQTLSSSMPILPETRSVWINLVPHFEDILINGERVSENLKQQIFICLVKVWKDRAWRDVDHEKINTGAEQLLRSLINQLPSADMHKKLELTDTLYWFVLQSLYHHIPLSPETQKFFVESLTGEIDRLWRTTPGMKELDLSPEAFIAYEGISDSICVLKGFIDEYYGQDNFREDISEWVFSSLVNLLNNNHWEAVNYLFSEYRKV